MKQHLILYETKKWDELTSDEKDKVLEENYHCQVEYWDWWDACYDWFKERLEKIGVSCESFYFDLDRARYIYMEKPSIDDANLFLKGAGADRRKKDARAFIEGEDYLSIGTNHYGGGTAMNYVDGDVEDVDLTAYLNSILEEFLSDLRKEYEWLTSEESLAEHFIVNDYDFLPETGEIF